MTVATLPEPAPPGPPDAALAQLAPRARSPPSSRSRSRSPLLPAGPAFWVAFAAAGLVALTAVVNAWGRYTGGLLVAPAIAVLVMMNIFPLLWSLGLSFFAYRADRQTMNFLGLRNYERALTDPMVWDRLTTTALFVVLTVTAQMVIGFLLALLFAKQFPLRRYLLILVLTPMMLSFVAVGAFFRYYYDPTFGLRQPGR